MNRLDTLAKLLRRDFDLLQSFYIHRTAQYRHTQKHMDIPPCLRRDPNPQSKFSSVETYRSKNTGRGSSCL